MPGHTKCAVIYCNNKSTSLQLNNNNIVSFHRFPKSPAIRKAWIDFCKENKDWKPSDSSRICSEHFDSSCFEQNYVDQYFHSSSRRRLVKNAIPTKSFNSWDQSHEHEVELPEVETPFSLPVGPLMPSTNNNEGFEPTQVENVEYNQKSEREIELENELKTKEKQIEHQIKLNQQLRLFNNTLVCQLAEERRKTAQLEEIIEEQKKKHSNCIERGYLHRKIKEHLSGSLSSTQLDLILKIKRKVKWGREDISKAITLRYFSKRAYLFLQNEKYPLPNLRTIQLYCGKISLSTGILTDVLKFMSIDAHSMEDKERAIVLLYDEMKVSSVYEFNQHKDVIMGPHNYAQVVMARSLFGNWKQPVYIGFDKNMNDGLLKEIILALFNAKFEVVAVVGDCGPSNQGTLSDLGIGIERQNFPHPVTQEPIFCFPDAPHLLKLIRNWLLRTGYKLPNGVRITKELLVDMIQTAEKSEISSLFKITERHITCEDNADKQNVALACQLFSHTTATALRRYYNTSDSNNLADFIQLVNDWFDVMNSRNLREVIELKKPYEGSMRQNEILDRMYETIGTSRCIGKNNLQVFQRSILISIRALQGLFEEMKKKYRIKFILTSKLNQDALENLFSILRTRGGLDDHPTPMNFINRMRMILLGKKPGIVHSRTNILPHDEEEITLTNRVFERADVVPIISTNEEEDLDLDTITSSGLSTSSAGSSENNFIEKDGVSYLSGWLARKFSKQHPDLGTYTYMLEHCDHSYAKPSWVTELSYGGLTEPSTKLKRSIEYLEKKFKKINKNTFLTKKNLLNKLVRVLKAKVDIPEVVTRAFLKQRIFIRIKKLNLKKSLQKKNKGKSKAASKLRKMR